MATTSARTLRLLSMLGAGRTWSGPELCDRLGVSPRTLRRDVEVLREMGYAVDPVKGIGGGYRLGPGGALPPVVLDEDQVVAVVVALQTASTALRGIEESAQRALAALRHVMPRRLRTDADLPIIPVVNQWEFPAEPIEAALVREVGAAVRRRQVLRLDDDGDPLRVEPHHLVVWAARWYLVAFDLWAARWRVLRLDRITVHPPTGAGFAERPLPDGGPVEFVRHTADRGDRPAPWPCLGHVELALPAAVVAEFAPGGAVVEAVSTTSCRLTMGAWSWSGLAGLYLTFGAEMTHVEPAELREAFGAAHARLARAVVVGGSS
ncbi:helix-turn-helix transcriptional regulator [Actinomycetospora termitidis]|uniref:WYL domain-containing protein n=1 Tax=Actinomycetospora termitidis TaxID=3053470 RepID=A0ABT7M2R5_9PSEU|nr:WYL domain-containing protein [Actinomycetospora sp. Odt1-22]MDL5154957.1 WYL domain-containing protein [Actinomycetospora sp. Odt1-22]